jgi:transposase
MLQLTPQMRILVSVEPVDFRKGIDGLARACREVLSSDPFSGAVFVFRNRRATAVKILSYDGQGFWLCKNAYPRGVFAIGLVETGRWSESYWPMSCRCR